MAVLAWDTLRVYILEKTREVLLGSRVPTCIPAMDHMDVCGTKSSSGHSTTLFQDPVTHKGGLGFLLLILRACKPLLTSAATAHLRDRIPVVLILVAPVINLTKLSRYYASCLVIMDVRTVHPLCINYCDAWIALTNTHLELLTLSIRCPSGRRAVARSEYEENIRAP